MKSIKLRARAKINLSIDILGLLDDGYHDVEMVMQSVDLSDYLHIRRKENGFKLVISNSDLPSDNKNIVYKTWEHMKNKYNINEGVEVFLEKNIPIAAGMAGGSADSAAMLVGLNEMFELGLSVDELVEESKALGSDIAFCITGGTCLATGTGTDIVRLNPLSNDIDILICKPNEFISTKKVYKKFDKIFLSENGKYKENILDEKEMIRPNNKKIIEALDNSDKDLLINNMSNVLEPVTKTWCSKIRSIEETMLEEGAFFSMMSGSGPATFGMFDEGREIKKCSNKLRRKFRQTYITKPSDRGVEICEYK